MGETERLALQGAARALTQVIPISSGGPEASKIKGLIELVRRRLDKGDRFFAFHDNNGRFLFSTGRIAHDLHALGVAVDIDVFERNIEGFKMLNGLLRIVARRPAINKEWDFHGFSYAAGAANEKPLERKH